MNSGRGGGGGRLNGTVYWQLQDGQGSTRQLLNSSQTIVQSYTADSFGNSVSSSGTVPSNPFKWNGGSGYYSDSESGLQKVGARYYDPQVGRWISQDTLLIAGSPADSEAVNRYLYCGGNPIERIDPNGMRVVWAISGAIGGARVGFLIGAGFTFGLGAPIGAAIGFVVGGAIGWFLPDPDPPTGWTKKQLDVAVDVPVNGQPVVH